MTELHNEYTNVFSRLDLGSCFYKNAYGYIIKMQYADSQEGQ